MSNLGLLGVMRPQSAAHRDSVTKAPRLYASLSDAALRALGVWAGCANYWKLDDDGATVADYFGGNTGNVTGATFTTGKVNGGRSFNGSSDKIITQLNVVLTGAFSVAAWTKLTSTQNAKSSVIPASAQWEIGTDFFVANKFRLWTPAGQIVSANTYFDGLWHHVVATWDASVPVLYVDGDADVVTGSPLVIAATGDPIYMGFYGSSYMPALIDEVGIWTRALTAAEVLDLYSSGTGIQP